MQAGAGDIPRSLSGGGAAPRARPPRQLLLAQAPDLSSDWGLEQSNSPQRWMRTEAGGGAAGGGERRGMEA